MNIVTRGFSPHKHLIITRGYDPKWIYGFREVLRLVSTIRKTLELESIIWKKN